ncbi:MAG: hypothetical protein V3575_01985 [Candidatus Absconditabacteria bacterium]
MEKNYFFSFDFICRVDSVFYNYSIGKVNQGDLLYDGNRYYLSLGRNISFEELIIDEIGFDDDISIIYKSFLSKNVVDIIHNIVKQNFSLYRLVIPMFLSDEIRNLLKRASKKLNKNVEFIDYSNFRNSRTIKKQTGQQLVLFPDLWSVYNEIDNEYMSLDGVEMLNSKSTNIQKGKTFWNIKSGVTNTLICTHSQIFQDWLNLSKIIIYSPHQRYYKNQKDPRYSTSDILLLYEECYKAEVFYEKDYRLFEKYKI